MDGIQLSGLMKLVMLACCEPGLRSVGNGYCYGMAVMEDRRWDCHLCIEKDRNRVRVRRSLVMVTGDGIGVVSSYCTRLGSRETLSLVHLFSSSPTVNNGRWG